MAKVLLCLEDYNELFFIETLLKKLGFEIESIRSEVPLSEKLLGFRPELIVCTGAGNKIDARRVAKKNKRRGDFPRVLGLYPRQAIPPIEVLSKHHIDAALETPASPRTLILACSQLLEIDPGPFMTKFERLPIAKDPQAQLQGQPIKNAVTQGDVSVIKGGIRKSEMQIVKKQKGSQKKGGGITDDKEDDIHADFPGQSEPPGNDLPYDEQKSIEPASPDDDLGEGLSPEDRRKRYQEFLKKAEPISDAGGFARKEIKNQVKEIRAYEKAHPELKDIDEQRKEFVKKLFKKKKKS